MMWIKKYWTVDKPKDPREYLGRFVKVRDDDGEEVVVEIERITGNLVHPWKFQIDNGTKSYLINMLDFYAQMNGEKVTQQEILEFELAFRNAHVTKGTGKKYGIMNRLSRLVRN